MTTAPESRVTTLPESLPLAEAQLLSTPPAEAQLLTLPAEEQLSIPPDDTLPTTAPTERPLWRDGLTIVRYYLGNRWALLTLGTGVLIAGAALNWSWLVAVGLAPILIAVAPCAIMCAVGLCAMLERNLDLAEALRITGTPGFAVGDKVVTGARDLKGLQALISEARNRP